uniref:Uncharacterized protein n=1 Tax=Romanomermis culicivorax TaxID=13658 RepID=A0A915I0R5_ROMCU
MHTTYIPSKYNRPQDLLCYRQYHHQHHQCLQFLARNQLEHHHQHGILFHPENQHQLCAWLATARLEVIPAALPLCSVDGNGKLIFLLGSQALYCTNKFWKYFSPRLCQIHIGCVPYIELMEYTDILSKDKTGIDQHLHILSSFNKPSTPPPKPFTHKSIFDCRHGIYENVFYNASGAPT